MAALQNILILDTETTGLSPADSVCIEVGAILFNVPQKAVVTQLSFVLPCLLNPAEHINHIPASVTTLGPGPEAGLSLFMQLVEQSDAIVAHNTLFDRQWFGQGNLPALPESKPWICTMADVSWPKELGIKNRPSVIGLALAHGVPVWAAHRALTDCIYLAQVFERCHDLQGLLENAQQPRFLYRALVSYDDRQLAKDAGFSWNSDGGKTWTRKLTEAEVGDLPFSVQKIDQ
jgi:DNA polymerase-3 subunit epsilon